MTWITILFRLLSKKNTQKIPCICLITILLKLNITIKVILSQGKWFTMETIWNSVLQSLHKNCPPRARNPLTPTQCDKHRGQNQTNYKEWSSLIQRTQADNTQICSSYCWNKIQDFKCYIDKGQFCDKYKHILSIRKPNSNSIIIVTIKKINTASFSYFNFKDKDKKLSYLTNSLKRDYILL